MWPARARQAVRDYISSSRTGTVNNSEDNGGRPAALTAAERLVPEYGPGLVADVQAAHDPN